MTDAVRTALELKNAARTIDWARAALGLSYAELAGATGASERTVIRWAQQTHPPRRQHRQRIEKLNELRQLLANLFGPNATTAREWLHDAGPSLRGRTPMSLLVQGQIDDVIGALTGLEAGAFG
jgi:transcriptional regulator with XRE-family HTH domain